MALAPPRLAPPFNQNPIADDGQYHQAWSNYHQDVADQLNATVLRMLSLEALVATLREELARR